MHWLASHAILGRMPQVKNLTHEHLLQHFESVAAQRIAAVPEYEAVEVSLPRKDAKGKLILDADGVPELVTKRVQKRAMVEAEENDRLAKLRLQYPAMVEAPVCAPMPRVSSSRERVEV